MPRSLFSSQLEDHIVCLITRIVDRLTIQSQYSVEKLTEKEALFPYKPLSPDPKYEYLEQGFDQLKIVNGTITYYDFFIGRIVLIDDILFTKRERYYEINKRRIRFDEVSRLQTFLESIIDITKTQQMMLEKVLFLLE